MSTTRALIFANGLLPDLEAVRNLVQEGDALYAADGGASHILHLGLLPGLVVGDLDSLPNEDLERLQAAGVRIVRYPQDKDLTDLELTLNSALADGHKTIVILAALGGRLDMILGNLNLLTRPDLRQFDIKLDDGVEQAFFVSEEVSIAGKTGDIVSLLPWRGVVKDVSTVGLRWPLIGEDLKPFESRSISNEMQTSNAIIRIGSGLLLCIHRRQIQTG